MLAQDYNRVKCKFNQLALYLTIAHERGKIMASESDTQKEGRVHITFNSYLKRLQADESDKPEPLRRDVPTVKELADVAGVHEVTLHNIVNSKVTRLNLETMQVVLDEMWRRGFEPQLTDFIRYEPPTGGQP